MSYDLSIYRKANPEDPEEESSITLEEWLDYIRNDEAPELMPADQPSEANGRGFCEWTAHPLHREPGARPPFEYCKGGITTFNVDRHTLNKMFDIAAALGGYVQGQDGEIYDEEDFPPSGSGQPPATEAPASKKPWWRFW